MNKFQVFLKAHSPTILTVIGSLGVIGTSVLAVKNTPKALELINDARLEKQDDLTVAETIKAAWKPYIPSMISGVCTIFCIAGANYLNIKKQQSIISAYTLLDNAFKEYRRNIKEQYGENVDSDIYKEVSKEQLEAMQNDIYANTLFFEFNSMRFFEADIHKVLQAECKAKIQFDKLGYLTLNDYYSYLGIEPSSYGESMGWSKFQMETEEYTSDLEFSYERVIMTNGLVCYNIITNVNPSMDHFCF